MPLQVGKSSDLEWEGILPDIQTEALALQEKSQSLSNFVWSLLENHRRVLDGKKFCSNEFLYRSTQPTCTFIQLALLGLRLPLKVTVPSMIMEAAWIPTRLSTGASSMVPFTSPPRALELSLQRGMSDLQMYCSTSPARLLAFTLWAK